MTRAIVDTNLSILLIAGLCGPRHIRSHKRLQGFDYDDYETLISLLAGKEIVLSPNVLTETSNLLRQIREPMRSELSDQMAGVVLRNRELYVESLKAVETFEFATLGLTDAILLECLKVEEATLYTADLHLYLAALSRGFPTQNFNHLRDQRTDFQ